jgi:hypothetical protein
MACPESLPLISSLTIREPRTSQELRMSVTSIARSGLLLLALAVGFSAFGFGQSQPSPKSASDTPSQNLAIELQKVDLLIEQNKRLEKQNQELMSEIESLRHALAPGTPAAAHSAEAQPFAAPKQAYDNDGEPTGPVVAVVNKDQQPHWGTYTPNGGFKIANTEYGDLNLSIYTYVRYLNQLGLDPTYTDAFGNVKSVLRRQDFQIQKVQIKFLGWLFNQKFRYFLYAWTSNATQGQGAQVVLAGNVNYTFNKHFNLAGGITSLPGTRSVEGNFPFWLGVDTRLITDEFFRPSYTSGVWARGEIGKRVYYQAMIGNNLSTLGVSAARLNHKPDTVATALIWMPTTGEFGQGFGDFEDHQKLATRFAAHFTRSTEDTESQPNSDQFENTQIRLEDGTVIFTPNLFGDGITVTDVNYKMVAFDSGIKFHGFSLDGEYFLRWLNNFKGPGTAGLPQIFSHGFQTQISAMLKPKTVQLYAGGSTLFGKYGNPWDFRTGTNVFPFKNKVLRWNTEFLYLHQSPVGYTSVPFAIGGTGPVVHTNIELAF